MTTSSTLLLDSAAMGVNVVEREGISFSHPARFMLVGTMNPEEGDLRPQLLDRFALCVDMHGIADPRQRVAIVERRVAYESDPEGFYGEWLPHEEQISDEIAQARAALTHVTYTQRDLYTIAQLTTSFKVDGHRADIVILEDRPRPRGLAGPAGDRRAGHPAGGRAGAAASPQAPTVRGGGARCRPARRPAEEGPRRSAAQQPAPARQPGTDHGVRKKSVEPLAEPSDASASGEPQEQDAGQAQASNTGPQAGRQVKVGADFQAKRLDTPLDKLTRKTAGKRSFTLTERKRGRYIRSRPMVGRPEDLAFDATFRTAAPFQRRRSSERAERKLAFVVKRQDFQKKVRVRRSANLVLFVVDASWSMAAAERMEATKGAILSLLHDAYQRRDQVGLVVFQREEARVVLAPTSSVELAQQHLRNIPVGGKTPLSAGLLAAYRVCIASQRRNPEIAPLIIILTDGAGNVSVTGMPPQQEAGKVALMMHDSHLRTVVINMEHPAFDRGLAQELANALGGPCYTLPELKAETLVQTVRQELSSKPGEVLGLPGSASRAATGSPQPGDTPGAFASGLRP